MTATAVRLSGFVREMAPEKVEGVSGLQACGDALEEVDGTTCSMEEAVRIVMMSA